jgi:hypothetical protein
VPPLVDEKYLVEIFFVFGQGVLVDSFNVELDCSLNKILEMTRKSLFRLFGNEHSNGPSDGHEEQIENSRFVLIIQLIRHEQFHIVVIFLFAMLALRFVLLVFLVILVMVLN